MILFEIFFEVVQHIFSEINKMNINRNYFHVGMTH